MKRLFLGSVALVALGLGMPAAFAADRGVPAYAPPPPPAPVYTWSGCYAGASAGTSSGRSDGFSTTSASRGISGAGVFLPVFVQPLTGTFNLSGFIGGGYVGCNYQAGMWVFGVEGDWSATNKEGQAWIITTNAGPGGTVYSSSDQFHLQERWL